MKKQLLLFFLMMLPLVASAYPVEIDGIWYNLTAETKQAEVTTDYPGYTGSVVIPEKVTYESVEYSVTSIGDRAFKMRGITAVTIPNSVTSIGEQAFYLCEGLTSITIPNSVTNISKEAFLDCSNLTSVNIPNSLVTIKKGTFQRCRQLTSIIIPNSVKSIWEDAFDSCVGLTSLTIPNSVTSIDSQAFKGCSGLTSITVEEGNSTFDSRDNCNAIIETSTNQLILGCQNTKIPNNVTSIGDYAFYRCSGLTSVTIPNSVTSIGDHAFYGCSKLTSVTIPNSVTSIEWDAFRSCFNLTSVTIPNSVTSIKSFAFFGNPNLSVVVSLIENPFSISYVFGDYSYSGSGDYFNNATLYVPVGTKEKYQATDGWKDFVNIVEGTPTSIKVIENIQNKNATIYDLNGVRLSEPKKGINIINGQKVVMK